MTRPPRRALACLILGFVLALGGCAADYAEGDYIPSARRGQFHGRRTQWHDLLGRHCPKFGVERVVAIPLPPPIGYLTTDEYRLQLSFEGDRLLTPWLLVLGRRGGQVPYLDVEMLRSGGRLVSVSARVLPLPAEDVARHRELVAEFVNGTHWPKHLVAHYRWQARHEVDGQAGLTAVFAAALAVFGLVATGVARGYRSKLRAFLADVAAEGGAHGVMAGKAD